MAVLDTFTSVGSLALLACALFGCGEGSRAHADATTAAEAEAEPEAQVPTRAPFERAWLRVDAPADDMELEAVEAGIVRPIEEALRGVPGLAHLTVEIRRAQARFELDFEPERYAAAMDEIRVRMATLQDAQPELGLAQAPRPYEHAAADAVVTYVIESVSYDLGALAAGSRALVDVLRGSPGVMKVESCAPRARLFVELDPARLLAFALTPEAVEASLRAALDTRERTTGPLTLAALRRYELRGSANAVRLASIAAFRVSYRAPPCVAAGPQGMAASVRVEFAGPELAVRLRERLERVEGALPEGVGLRRIASGAASLSVSLDPSLGTEGGAQLLGAGFGHDEPSWLVEVGVATASCWGSGLTARMFLPEGTPPAAVAQALRKHPEVHAVDSLAAPTLSLWRALGEAGDHNPAELEASEAQALQLTEVAGVAGVRLHAQPLGRDVEVEANDARLVAVGLTRASFDAQLALIEGVEIGGVVDRIGEPLPVTLVLAGTNTNTNTNAEGDTLERLREATLIAAGQTLPLVQLASLRAEAQRERVCRRDRRAALLLSVTPEPDTERAALERALEAVLAQESAPSWTPGWR